jgi:hypothetical protein
MNAMDISDLWDIINDISWLKSKGFMTNRPYCVKVNSKDCGQIRLYTDPSMIKAIRELEMKYTYMYIKRVLQLQ